MIVVWSTSKDSTAARVSTALETSGANFLTLNTDEYGKEYFVEFFNGEQFLCGNQFNISPSKIQAVYYRRPSLTEIPESDRDFSIHEAWYFTRAVMLEATNAIWMNHPGQILLAENKLRQLRVAGSVGLNVPRCCIPRTAKQAHDFYTSVGRKCICKPGYAGILKIPGEESKSVYAWRIPEDYSVEDFEIVTDCPTFLQEEIVKRADHRVTVVGEKSVSVRISPKQKGVLDWRTKLNGGLLYEINSVPSDVHHGICRIMKNLGLSYAAFDFCEDENGRWFFLELNPAGQWEWLDQEAGTRISHDISDALIRSTL